MSSSSAAASYERFKEFRDGVVPELLAGGWTIDPDGPRVPNPCSPSSPSLPRVRLIYRNPADGLYYGLKDAVRVALGDRPRREGVPKLTERQKDAVLRYLYDPENAASIVGDCQEFLHEEEEFSGLRRAVEHFIETLRANVGR
jgi:hypothetical protein